MFTAVSLPKSRASAVASLSFVGARGLATTAFEMIKVTKVGEKNNVGLITLNRPKALNSLCSQLLNEVGHAVNDLNADKSVGCIVLTGSERAFAAGADIKEMSGRGFKDVVFNDKSFNGLRILADSTKPTIAAVNGYALGGGCEMAMVCDMIIAGDNAKFGQPEIKLGTLPGAGGTQRLPKAVGKSLAMYMGLTGEMIDAEKAVQSGLAVKVFPQDKTVEESIKIAETIASYSHIAAAMVKEGINKSYETTLSAGLHLEQRLFASTFATYDRKEGMDAFANKRPPVFKNE